MTDPSHESPQDDGAADIERLRPQKALAIGLTGHRADRLGQENTAAVAIALDGIFAAIEQAAQPIVPSSLRLVTGLADGADTIAATRAIARGWTFDAVLPFPREEYARDFADGAPRATYMDRLAACSAVMELPGDRMLADGEAIAYERAGRVVLGQSDILIAVWDGGPARGRGGTPQIVAEAVLLGIPVIHVHPADVHPPALLWDGLEERDLGQQTIETIARGELSALSDLLRDILDSPASPDDRIALDRLEGSLPHRRRITAFAYPLLLGVMGIKRLRLADLVGRFDSTRAAAEIPAICSPRDEIAVWVCDRLAPRFARADLLATDAAQRFRSVYVANFVLAAMAVLLSLLGLALPPGAKPVLILLELLTIGTILFQTRAGRRGAWHRLWLDNRALAERLRCLAVSSRLGELELRTGGDDRSGSWVGWYAAATARELGLPSARIDATYLQAVRDDLLALLDGQVAYLMSDARRMHRLEHRLHKLGTVLFALTAVACLALLAFKVMAVMLDELHPFSHPFAIATTIISAALPAMGAAIYGIRMQGDFAGIAERNHALATNLSTLREVIVEDEITFDMLSRRARRVTGLLTADLRSWLQTYHARPLALPG